MPRRLAAVLPWAVLAVLAAEFLRAAWVSDDAFITFRVVDNLWHGYGPRWNVAERVQAFTHPLWFGILAGVQGVGADLFRGAAVLGVALSLVAAWLAVRAGEDPWAALGVGALLAGSKAVVEYATSGLENALSFALVAGLLVAGPRRPRLAATLAGLAMLNRLDLALLVLPPLAVALVGVPRREALRALVLGFAPLAAWSLFALAYYGSPFPNTATAKLFTGIPRGELLGAGLGYLVDGVALDPVTLLGIAAGAAVGFLSPDRFRRAAGAGIVLTTLYVVWVGGDFMRGRFLSVPLIAAAVLLGRAPLPRALAGAALVGWVVGLATPLGPDFRLAVDAAERAALITPRGIADERAFYLEDGGLWTPPPPPGPAPRFEEEVRRRRDPILVEDAVGKVGFRVGPAVHVVDVFALADPFLARLPALHDDSRYREFLHRLGGASPVLGWRPGHFRRVVPPGYLAFLLGDPWRFQDPRLRQLAEKTALVARGPLWSAARWAQIGRFLAGRDRDLVDRVAYAVDRPVPWEEVTAVRPDAVVGWLALADARLAAGDAAGARAAWEVALRVDPANTKALHELGVAAVEARDWAGAEGRFRALAALAPRDAGTAANLAGVLVRLGRRDEAARWARRALELDPELEAARVHLRAAEGR